MWQREMGSMSCRGKNTLVQCLEYLPEEFKVVRKGSSPNKGDLECPEQEKESV